MKGEEADCAFFWDYLDGELDEDVSRAYGRHLASCGACRLNLEEYSLIAESLRWQGEDEPPEGLRRALLEEFRREYPDSLRGKKVAFWAAILNRPLSVPAWGAAAALLGVLGLAYLMPHGSGAGKGAAAQPPPREEFVAYQVYGPDGVLKAAVRTTIRREEAR